MLQSMSDDQVNVLTTLNIVFASISIVLLLIFLFGYIKIRSMRTFSNELLLYLCISELLLNIFSLLNDPDNGIKCQIHAFAQIVFPFVSL